MAENEHKPEKAVPCCSTVEHPKLISLSEERRNLISVANKVFGEGKWSHTVVKQGLYFHNVDSNEVDSDDEHIDDEINARKKYRTKYISYIKIQLENGNCYEDDGFYIAKKSTKGLSIQNARIGSAVNALKKVLLSFGDTVERELQQLQRQISSEQVNTFAAGEPTDLAINFHDLISVANKVFGEGKWNHTVVR
ncbi:DNA repair protein RAD52 homolog [Temnothorax americanus]|uniref:DNA repair protein RAD52 homolog n=1 Tax=Temnothorax americanus TaxID=1964332 RepID=UPI0040684A52